MSGKQHWEKVYTTKSSQHVSWYQQHASLSLQLIQSAVSATDACIIDVGGGASTLVDDLQVAGYRHLTILDLSGEALALAQKRLGGMSQIVTWIEDDVTTAPLPEHRYDLWHDRAVFHFLTEEADRRAYVAQVLRTVKPGGHVIVATFASDGPAQCSGLPVHRYTIEELQAAFGSSFELIKHAQEDHMTPGGQRQHFIYCHWCTPSAVEGLLGGE